MRRPRPPYAATLALLGLVACADPGEPPPSVVLVLVDQLRHDAVERFMPRVDALAERGVRFENMRAAAPWTYPSVISLFSGLYPQQHGADGAPGVGTSDEGQVLSTFDAGVPLLPRLLGDTHATAGFVTNPFLQVWNPFHEGFDHYEIDRFIGSQGNRRGRPDLVWTEHMFADSVNAAVREHFDARPFDGPEFVYVHYIDVHGPWDGAPFDAGGADHRTTADAAYATAAAYVDERIVELYEYFLARTGGDLLFAVTSDHGQELGDDLELAEGRPVRQRKATVHDFNLRIPFLLLPSDRLPAARRIDCACSNVDVSATLLDWTGHAPIRLSPGRSLKGLALGEADCGNPRAIYALHSAWGRYNDGILFDGQKLIRHTDPATGETALRVVFDVDADPRESRVVSQQFGAYGNFLLEAAKTNGVEFPKRFEKPSDADLRAMQALGYLGEDEPRD